MKSENCEIVQTEIVKLAAIEVFTDHTEIPQHIPRLLDLLYSWLKDNGVTADGQNHAVYDQFSSLGMRLRVGVPISEPFAESKDVTCLTMPIIKAAHLQHVGPYRELPEVHRHLNQWIAAEDLQPVGMAWEVYGDWVDDEQQLVTDVYVGVF